MITVRKLKLIIVNENEELRKEQYKFIRDSQYAQYQALNLGILLIYKKLNKTHMGNLLSKGWGIRLDGKG